MRVAPGSGGVLRVNRRAVVTRGTRSNVRAVDGKAAEAVLRVVVAAFGMRGSKVCLVNGATSRDKIMEIIGNQQELTQRVPVLRMT
jgi:uncharacterized protein YggU (UPF0235/DUF167 family)